MFEIFFGKKNPSITLKWSLRYIGTIIHIGYIQ